MLVIVSTSAQNIFHSSDHSATIRFFTTKDGLSHNSTNGIYQDSRNLYWITTRYGLNRFDGHQFQLYTKEKNGLHSNIFDLAYEDKNPNNDDAQTGLIWLISSLGSSAVWFIEEDNAFHYSIFNPYTEQVIDAEAYLGKELYQHLKNIAAFEKRDNYLLFLTHTGHIIKYYHRDKVEITSLKKPVPGFHFYKKLSNHQYWAGFKEIPFNNMKLFSKDHQLLQQQQFCHYSGHACDNMAACMGDPLNIPTNNKSDSLWFTSLGGTSTLNSIFCLLPTGKILTLPSYSFLPNYPKNQTLNIIYYDAEKHLFWLSDNLNTYIVHRNKKLVTTLDFPLDNLWLKDKQGLYWANNKNGLFAIQLNKIPFQKHLQGEAVRGIVVDKQNRIWAYPRFIEGVEEVQDSLRFNYKYFLSSHSVMKDEEETIWSFCIRANQLWLGKFRPENNGKGTLIPINLPKIRMWSIYKEKKTGLFWGGGERGILFSYNLENQKTTFIEKTNGIDAFKEATIYQIKPYGEQHFWLATSNGLYLADKTEGILARYWQGGQEEFHLPLDAAHHIHIDQDKQFWLGSRDAGLLQVAVTQNKTTPTAFQLNLIQHFTIANGLPSNAIHAIYENPQPDGYLWLNTENGIVQFHKTAHFSSNFSVEDGIVHTEGNRISHYQSEDGRLYFGSIDGVTSFHPKDFSLEPETQQKYIHLVGFDQYSVTNHQMENKIASFQNGEKIVLPAKEGRIELTLSQPFSLGVKNIFYTWQIQGLHPEPTPLLQPKITISDVPFGKYTLTLKALNSKGDLLDSKDIPLISKPPFYLQWWFLGSLLLMGGILAYLLILYRTKALVRQKALLEAEVRQRTQQLEADKIIIEQQAQELKELDETKSRFFANVSHELRTPLQLIQGPIRSVLNMNILNNRGFTLLLKAERNSQNLLRLVNEILDLTKLEVNKLALREEKVVFYTFIRRIISNFQSIADHKSIHFTFIYRPKETMQVELDTDKLEKILNNLITNALKFTPKGGRIEVEVSDTSETSDTYFQIKVKDNGRGIPPSDVPHIFNRFYQSSNNQKAEGGLGIGLALSMEFIKLMNGKMWVESNIHPPHQGTIFYVQFPKKEIMTMLSTEDHLNIEAPILKPKASNGKKTNLLKSTSSNKKEQQQTILLVEDNHDLQDYLSFLLAPHYNLITAENGKEGLERLTADGGRQTVDGRRWTANGQKRTIKNRKAFSNEITVHHPPSAVHRQPSTVNRPPSLIISDIMMPVMDGFEFLEKVKAEEKWRHIPVIMLTARAAMKDKLKALRIGVDDYLVKPFKEEELLVRIENLLSNAKERAAFIKTQAPSSEDKSEEVNQLSIAENKWLEKTESLVLKHLTDNRFSVDFLADLLSINRKTLYQKTKALTGLTPNQYIQTIRLQRAKECLEQGKYTTVKAVANEVGFLRADYFSRLYVKAFGKAPIEYFR